MGNFSMIHHLTRFLIEKHESYDWIWNIGICGYRDIDDKRKDTLIQCVRSVSLASKKECVFPVFVRVGAFSTIASTETPMTEKTDLQYDFVDMESYGFGYVMERFAFPYLCLKIPYDCV
jgi:hypothetical protein